MIPLKQYAANFVYLLLVGLLMGGSPAVCLATTSADHLPALIKETAAHFQLAFRMRPNEARDRQEQLEAVVAAWRAAPRSAGNDQALANWLRSAIRSSMPGQRDVLPPIPDFKSAIQNNKAITESAPVERSPTVAPVSPQPSPSEEVQAKESTASPPILEKAASNTPTTELSPPSLGSVEGPSAASDETTDPFRDDPITDESGEE